MAGFRLQRSLIIWKNPSAVWQGDFCRVDVCIKIAEISGDSSARLGEFQAEVLNNIVKVNKLGLFFVENINELLCGN